MSKTITQRTALPLYQMVKEHIIERVKRGDLKNGGKLPSESELVEELGVSRMTVHRALRELSAAGIVDRVQGLGTFVSAPQNRSELMELKDIGEDIVLRGNEHTQDIKVLETIRAEPEQCAYFDIQRGSKLFHSVIVHKEDGIPIQVEDRLILPNFAPDYLTHDFFAVPASRYLRSIVDASKIEHVVYATMADAEICEFLGFDAPRPCMVVTRRTWVDDVPVTLSTFTYPGDTYSLVSRRTA